MGKKLRYETVEAFDAAIEDYFEKCKGHALLDKEGNAITDKNGIPIIVDAHPPTMTGLALALGFTSRQAMLNYKHRKAYLDSYLRARARCEAYAEERLFDRDGARGAQFALQYCYGWRQEKEPEKDQGGVVIVDDL